MLHDLRPKPLVRTLYWACAPLILGTCALVLSSSPKDAAAQSAEGQGAPQTRGNPERYPYDPVCPWGRLADGHGMLIRCLAPKEASLLLSGSLTEKTESHPKEKKSSSGPKRAASASQHVVVTKVGPAVADTGELPLAARKLGLPKERYVNCVRDNGGLTQATGKVEVRFLVRERGRAEGVGVKSFAGMSQAAAKCIADVVDRRYVGYPAAPIVGASIPIELSTKP